MNFDLNSVFNLDVTTSSEDVNSKIIKIFDSFCDYKFINKSEALRLLNSLFFTKEATKSIIYDSKIESFSFINNKDLEELIKDRFYILNIKEIQQYKEGLDVKDIKSFDYKISKMLSKIILNIKINNQIEIFAVEINPFLEKTKIVREGSKIRLIKNQIHFNSFESEVINLNIEDKNLYLNDFIKHFPQFIQMLDFIIACRFAKSRRKSYLYMRVNAGFGKSLIMDILKRTGIAISIELQQLKNNSAGEIHPTEFLNSICLCVDEFTHFAQELKSLTNKIQISAKFALRTELEVYAKIFFSAEKSTSFYSEAGVDVQLADRVSIIDIDSNIKLDDRELFKNNKSKYVEVLYEFTYKYFKGAIDKYLKNTKLESANIAENYLDKFNEQYKIKADNIEKIKSVIFEVLTDFRDLKESAIELKSTFEKELDKLIFLRTDKNIIIKNPTKLYELIVKEQSTSFYKNAIYKQTQLDKIFNINLEDKKVIKDINNKSIKGYLMNLEIEQEIHFMNEIIKYKNHNELCTNINTILRDYYEENHELDSHNNKLLEHLASKNRLVIYMRENSKSIISLGVMD